MLTSLKKLCLSRWSELCPGLPAPQDLKVVAYLPAGRIIHPKFIFLIFSESSREPVLIAKVPSRPDYAPTMKSAFDMLREFYSSSRLKDLAASVPRPLYEGEIQGFPLFLESYCSGRTLPLRGYHLRYEPYRCFASATAWLKQFHMKTGEITAGEEEINRLFISLIRTAASAFPQLDEKLKPLQERCLSLSQKPIPIVCSHGDYTAKNILFSRDAEDVRIIDWERHQKRDLPFFDLLKFALWFTCGRKRLSLFDGLKDCLVNDKRIKTAIRDYLSAMAIEKELEAILIPLYFVRRIGAIQRNIGKEAAKGHIGCLLAWLDFRSENSGVRSQSAIGG